MVSLMFSCPFCTSLCTGFPLQVGEFRWVISRYKLYHPVAAKDEPRKQTIFVLSLPNRRTMPGDGSKSKRYTSGRGRGQVETSFHHLFCAAGEAKDMIGVSLQAIPNVENSCQRHRFAAKGSRELSQ